jgi:long-chain acyl-CoA synthetase
MASYIYISTGISIYYAENLDTIGDNLKEVQPLLFATVPRLLEKVFDKIMAKGAELQSKKRKLFYWAVDLAEKYDNINKGSLSYRVQLALANVLIFKKWREALGGHVKFIITGGAACQVKLLRIFTAAKIPVFEGYGPTENCPVISVNCNKKGGTKFGTVGLVIDGQEVKIESDGEICVKGPSVMMGYYKHPEWTAEVIKDGWLHTGDIGIFEDGKYLKITDRKKEMFKTSGGKYVAPQVIENKLKESPFVEQLMVLGDNQKFVSALIVPSFSNLKTWMMSQSIVFTNNETAIQHPEVITFYNQIIENYNAHFNHVEQVKKIKLLSEEWGVFTGEMTPKLSLKRKVIMQKYEQEIQWIYK